MAWGRLALIQAAGENDAALQQVATLFGYQLIETPPPETQLLDKNTPQQADENPAQEPDKISKPQRPPALFLRINKLQTLENPDTGKPVYLDDPRKNLNNQTNPEGRSYSFAPPTPLLPMSRLIPFLHNGLGQTRAGGKLNHRRLIQQLALGKALRRLPYLPRKQWSQRLQIIVDPRPSLEPYWADFAFIIEKLQKLLGLEAVTAIRFDEQSLADDDVYCLPWPTQNQHHWQQWHKPPEDVAVLLLSDLGSSDNHPAARVRWQQLLKRLQNHTAPILTLSPVAHSPTNLSVCRLAKPNPLNDGYNLPRHPCRNGFALPENNNIADILALLSPLPLIDTGLLRRLRLELNWGSSDLESQLWNHPDMQQSGLGLCLQTSAIAKHHANYQALKDSVAAQKLWEIVKEHHKNAFQGLQHLEGFSQTVLDDMNTQTCEVLKTSQVYSVYDYYQKLCATVAQEPHDSARHTALLMQCQTALAMLPTTFWKNDSELKNVVYDLYALANADDIRAGRWQPPLLEGFDANRLEWILTEREKQQRVQWQIVQTGGRGQFSCQQVEPMTSNLQQDLTVRPEPVEGGTVKSIMVRQGSHERSRMAHHERLNLPIATLSAHPVFPPTLSIANSVQEVIGDKQTFTLETVCSIQSSFQRLEVEVISKPSWATGLWRDADGLFASIAWLGKTYTVAWQVDENSHWVWSLPFGEDDYGLYVDLNWSIYADFDFKNVIQRFRWIEAGTFLMGSPQDELERYDDETQHTVTLTQGYWLADSACTQALWLAVMGNNPARFNEELNNPVEQVSWDDVQNFIDKLNQLIPNLAACLPTEAQWEYACRAGTTTPFSFGKNITPEQVNYDGNYPYADGQKGLYREKTVAVKSLPPNAWGLYEMHGNVWEWCSDWFGDYSTEAVINPSGALEGTFRVLRGGSWNYYSRRTRSAYRSRYAPAYGFNYVGFRLALGQTAQPVQASGGSAPPVSGGAASGGEEQPSSEKKFFSRFFNRTKK